MRFPSLRQALATAAPLLLALTSACELPDFGHKDDDSDSSSLTATLSGKNEVPPADPDGSGTALLALNSRKGELCFEIEVKNIEPITAAHVHEAPAGANGPIVVDFDVQANTPLSCQGEPAVMVLRAKDSAPGDGFGFDVAFENDTAIVSAPNLNAAYAFVRKQGAWWEQQKLVPPDGGFVFSVALSGDTAALAGNGVVHVFVRSSGVWYRQQTLAPPGGLEQGFGADVALSGDTLLVGAPLDTLDPNNRGSAYVFVQSGASWTEQAKLPSGIALQGSDFGRAVALSGDFALVGGPQSQGFRGVAALFERNGTTWTRVALDTSTNKGGRLGSGVALSGTTALIGAPGHFVSEGKKVFDSGAAEVFARDEAGWVRQGMAVTPPLENRNTDVLSPLDLSAVSDFGRAVAVSGDLAVVGAPSPVFDVRAAYTFKRTGELWSQQNELRPTEKRPEVDLFGSSVAVSGTTVMVSTPGNEAISGAVFVYDLPICEDGSQKLSGCVDVEQNLLAAIRDNPERFYVNVHNDEFPDGAVRGQLAGDRDDSPHDWWW